MKKWERNTLYLILCLIVIMRLFSPRYQTVYQDLLVGIAMFILVLGMDVGGETENFMRKKLETIIVFMIGVLMVAMKLYPFLYKEIYWDCLVGLLMIVVIVGGITRSLRK